MTHLPEVIASYAAMSPWARELLRDIAADYAVRWPVVKKKKVGTGPALSVVAPVARVEEAPHSLNSDINRRFTVVACEPVDGK